MESESFVVEGRRVEAFAAVAVDDGDCNRLLVAGPWSTSQDRVFSTADGGTTWSDRGAQAPVTRLVPLGGGGFALGTQAGEIVRVSVPGPGATLLYRHPEGVGVADMVLAGAGLIATFGGDGLRVVDPDGAEPTREMTNFALGQDPGFAEAVAADPDVPGRILYFVSDVTPTLYELDASGPVAAPSPLELPEPGLEVVSLLVDAGGEWLGTNEAGVFWRPAGSAEFVHASVGLRAFDVADFAFDPTGSGALLAGGAAERGSGNGTVARWDPAVGQWVRWSGNGLPAGSGRGVAYRGGEAWALIDALGLYRWAPGAGSWEDRSAGFAATSDRRSIGSFLFHPAEPDRLLAGASPSLFLGTAGGLEWARVEGLPETSQQPWAVTAVPVQEGIRLLAGGGNGLSGWIYASDDGGESWVLLKDAIPPVLCLAASQRGTGRVLAGTAEGLWSSDDGGESWLRVDDVPEGFPVSAVAVSDSDEEGLAAFVQDKGVFVSTDRGASWAGVPDEGCLSDDGSMPSVRRLRFEPGGVRLVAALRHRGLWFVDLLPPSEVPVGRISVVSVESSGEVVLGLETVGRVEAVLLSSDMVNWREEAVAGELAYSVSGGGVRPVYVRLRGPSGRESATYQVVVQVPAVPPPGGGEPPGDGTEPPPGGGGAGASSPGGGGGGGGGCFLRALGGEW
ncbi:WD40/YVTN/BNR-like repeat-containing protein [Deferrisoma camini]|uniref:WD40/YVTN/BNR-like repeat-containing protein n=1 Tax=Deferrisoma camini TaxID=1035120 RepID=UPI00046D0B7E|nr:hypothetical protein [Deferrisoma camini]